jgi:hypothetical protein
MDFPAALTALTGSRENDPAVASAQFRAVPLVQVSKQFSSFVDVLDDGVEVRAGVRSVEESARISP